MHPDGPMMRRTIPIRDLPSAPPPAGNGTAVSVEAHGAGGNAGRPLSFALEGAMARALRELA